MEGGGEFKCKQVRDVSKLGRKMREDWIKKKGCSRIDYLNDFFMGDRGENDELEREEEFTELFLALLFLKERLCNMCNTPDIYF